MYNQGYEQKNTFNIIITSNNNSISLTQSNNIRYFVNTISDKYAGNKNTEYFKKLHKTINKEEVKIAIFKEFMNIFETQVKPYNWLGTDVKPTKSGTIKRIDALPKFIKYIKNT
jgi:protein gp37